MADPFSTGAGVVGVISLTCQITQTVVQFGMDWRDAPDDVRTFMTELGTLKTVLSETNTNILLNPDFAEAFQSQPSSLLLQLGPNAPSTSDTKLMLKTCQTELEYLLKELKQRSQGHRLGWERFKGAFLLKDTRQSVEKLSRQCQMLNNMLSIDTTRLGVSIYKEVKTGRKEQQEWRQAEMETSLAIRDGVDQFHHRQDNQEREQMYRNILDWLTPIDYAPQQHDFIGRRQPGTGQWLLDSAEFHAWLQKDQQTLFCRGIPGAGKTILTSIVVDELNTRFKNDKNIGIAYLYCNYRQQHEQKSKDLIASLLRQLIQGRSSLPDSIKSLYNSHKDTRTRLSFDETSRALQSVSALYSRVFIIVDALDECQVADGCRARFLSEISELQTKYQISYFATSRSISEINDRFEGSIPLEIRATKQDVRRYVDSHISHLPSFVGRNSELQEEIKTEIVKAVDGMFLLAQLHLNSLKGKKSPKAIRTSLAKLPTGSEAYERAYRDTMERIEGQLSDEEELAKQVLSWIICAKRPLTTSELQHAMAVEISNPELDEENTPEIENIVSVCAGLVTVDETSKNVRLVHYTTQEYFRQTRKRWFPNAETDITRICVTYLSFSIFDCGSCQTDDEFESRLRSYKLYDYAAHNWGHHAREASTACQEVIEFLECEAKVQASSQALTAVKWNSLDFGYSQQTPEQVTGIHLAAYFGVQEALNSFSNREYNMDLGDSYGQTPLSWAAQNGHEEAVQLLLDKGTGLESKDIFGLTPLSWAAVIGHDAVVQLLLGRYVDVESKDTISRQTSLLRAARGGLKAIVRLLLSKGANIDAKSNSGWTVPQIGEVNR